MYRKTKRYYERVDDESRRRCVSDPDDRPKDVPNFRRLLLVVDFDYGIKVHLFTMHKTQRIDSYRVRVNFKIWKESIGWARLLEGLRKALPRVRSSRNFD